MSGCGPRCGCDDCRSEREPPYDETGLEEDIAFLERLDRLTGDTDECPVCGLLVCIC